MSNKGFHLQSFKNISNIRYVIAVAAGKGGVGKSSVSVGLALSLKQAGFEVGVLDADIYGPSIAKMMPLEEGIVRDDVSFYPGSFQGVKTFSLAYLKPEGEAMIVRAPVANGLILQCIRDVSWGALDYLIVDFPPGTGDIQLTLMQEVSFSGAILVTTPQEISLIDVQKAAQMFHSMGVPILGIVENMAYFEEPSSQAKHYLFGKGGGGKLSKLFGAPLLGEIPIDPNLCLCGDLGLSVIKKFPGTISVKKFQEIALLAGDILFELESLDGKYLKNFELVWEEKK